MSNPETVTPMTQVGALPRDDNDSAVPSLGLQQSKTITFAAGTTGATGATTLFTVSGTVALNIIGFCTADLTGSGTIEVGTTTSTACLCDQQSATAIDNHEVWQDNLIAVGARVSSGWSVVNESVIQTIATDTVTGGTLTYYCNWVPLSQGATVIAA